MLDVDNNNFSVVCQATQKYEVAWIYAGLVLIPMTNIIAREKFG